NVQYYEIRNLLQRSCSDIHLQEISSHDTSLREYSHPWILAPRRLGRSQGADKSMIPHVINLAISRHQDEVGRVISIARSLEIPPKGELRQI
ncbi:unnamed protein product, partial [Porites evermanni]